ncbi:MAG: GTP-binding protein [Paracoccaceae bacterium]|nr:GTP-binding protein [Paracoccaceae bacterium]
MTLEKQRRIRLCIISGFLGAGKTTFLQHLVSTSKDEVTSVIVNELSENSVDDILLYRAGSIKKIIGGCICCTKKAELVEVLLSFCNKKTRQALSPRKRVETILVETSGVSDPGSIYNTIVNNAILSKHIIIEKVTVLLDATYKHPGKELQAFIRNQIINADEVIISKADLVTKKVVFEISDFIKTINSQAKISSSVKGKTKLLYQKESRSKNIIQHLPQEEQKYISEIFSLKIPLKNNTDWDDLVIWLSALLYCHGSNLLRVKGIVSSPIGPLLLQGVGKHIQYPQKLPNRFSSKAKYLILIGLNINKDIILESAKSINQEEKFKKN